MLVALGGVLAVFHALGGVLFSAIHGFMHILVDTPVWG